MPEKCESCSKEKNDRVPILRVIEKLDLCFKSNDLAAAKRLLDYWESEARAIADQRGLLEILNEQIGLTRRLNDKAKGLAASHEAISIIESEQLDTVSAATILINAATTLKAFGEVTVALPYYERALEIYINNNVSGFQLAALYNNMAAAKTEVKNFSSAQGYYLKAIEILRAENAETPEIAVSLINLAHLYYEQFPEDERIAKALNAAWDILDNPKLTQNSSLAFIYSKCAPSYGFFGYFLRDNELKERAQKIYEGT